MLWRKFQLVKNVRINGYGFYWDNIRPIIDTCKLISYEFPDEDEKIRIFGYRREFDWKDVKLWSTFEDLVDLNFYPKNNKIFCDVIISNGKNLSGVYIGTRIRMTIQIPKKNLNVLESRIENGYILFLESEFEEYEQTRKLLWMKNRSEQLLRDQTQDR